MNVFAVDADGDAPQSAAIGRRLPLAGRGRTVSATPAFAPPTWGVAPMATNDDAAPGRVELIEPAGDHRIVRIDAGGTPVTRQDRGRGRGLRRRRHGLGAA